LFSWSSVFELRECRPSGLWRSTLTTLTVFALFDQILEFRRPVTPHHRRSVLHGKPNHVVGLQSELSRIEKKLINCGEGCEQHQSGRLPQHPLIGQLTALAAWPVG
jgi:hypothetical protein